jgi:hypothetical protein
VLKEIGRRADMECRTARLHPAVRAKSSSSKKSQTRKPVKNGSIFLAQVKQKVMASGAIYLAERAPVWRK